MAVASLATSVLYFGILGLVGTALPELAVLLASAVSGAIYNGVLAIATYPIARTLHRTTAKQASFGL